MQSPIYNLKKEKVGTVELNDAVFSGEIKPHLINDAVRTQIARRYEYRTANSKTRSEVHGTKKKMYKQKGTGQARHGAATAPIFVGGGKAFGPKPRRRLQKMNKKAMRQALISVLSMHQKEDRLFIVDKLELAKLSTKSASQALEKAFGFETALVVNANSGEKEQFFNQSVRNLKGVKTLRPEGVNVFDLLKFKNLVLSQQALQKLTERLTHA